MNKQGSIVFALMLILVLSALGAGLLLSSVNENNIAKRTNASAQAFWLGESGVQRAIWEVNLNNCQGFVQEGTATACASCTSCGAGNKTLAATIANSGDYDIVMNNANTLITATGSSPSRTSPSRSTRTVQAEVGNVSPFAYAAFSQGQVTLANNTYIDSYDSADGPYNVSTNSNTNGDIGSNGTTAGIISIGNNISLGGDVSTGSGGTVNVGANTQITGTTTHSNSVALPAVVVPSSLTGLTSSGTYTVNTNGTRTLTAGNYKYDNMSLNNNGTLNITGEVNLYLTAATALTTGNNINLNIAEGGTLKIFVDGVLNVSNNVNLNVTGNQPSKFQVYSTYTGSNGVSINNNGELSAAIYAPNTNVSIGNNADFYGSLIGETISVNNNSAIHYDESLRNLETPAGPSGISEWQEV